MSNKMIEELEKSLEDIRSDRKRNRRSRVWLVAAFCFMMTLIGFTGIRYYMQQRWFLLWLELTVFWFDVCTLIYTIARGIIEDEEFRELERKHKAMIFSLKNDYLL